MTMSLQRTVVDAESLGRRKTSHSLIEIVANDRHVCRFGKVIETFEEVARALNDSNALPWNTNGKHCNDRYKLVLANFRRADRARALASGIEEEFGKREQLLADIQSAVNDNEKRGRTEREKSAKRDERLAKAGQEVRANAMSRKHGARSDAKSGNADEYGDDAERLTTSHYDEDMITPTNSRRGRTRKKHSTLELEDVLAATQEKRSEQEQMRLKSDIENLNFEKGRAKAHDRNEEKRLDIIAAQADLQRQQQSEKTRMQLKIFQVMEEMMKKMDR
jgi:hypothetical protein